MRIISSFKDYYDSGMSFGMDPKLIYVREEKEILVDKNDKVQKEFLDNHNLFRHTYHSHNILGFCGKVYPLYSFGSRIQCCSYNYLFANSKYERDFVNSQPSWLPGGQVKGDENWGKKISDDIFRKYNSPIIIASAPYGYSYLNEITLTINARLKDYQFMKIFDVVSCYQEISMYIGNELAKQEDPIIKHSDKLKAESHGFDKWSFRKMGKKSK